MSLLHLNMETWITSRWKSQGKSFDCVYRFEVGGIFITTIFFVSVAIPTILINIYNRGYDTQEMWKERGKNVYFTLYLFKYFQNMYYLWELSCLFEAPTIFEHGGTNDLMWERGQGFLVGGGTGLYYCQAQPQLNSTSTQTKAEVSLSSSWSSHPATHPGQ